MSFPPLGPGLPANWTDCVGLPPLDTSLCLQRLAEDDPRFANYSVCDSGGVPAFISNEPSCAEGLYCPHIDVNRSETWPQACPPTVECQLLRLGNQWCEPQGKYEPQLCLPGYYCPNRTMMLRCPAGTWCIRGSSHPRPCPDLSLCPEGTQIGRYYGGVLFAAILDAFLLIYFIWRRYFGEPRASRRNAIKRRDGLVDGYLHLLENKRIGYPAGQEDLASGIAGSLAIGSAGLGAMSYASHGFGRPSVTSEDCGGAFGAALQHMREDLSDALRGLRLSLRAALSGALGGLPDGMDTVVDFNSPRGPKLRVRTKSMRRSSGTGALFGLTDPDEAGTPKMPSRSYLSYGDIDDDAARTASLAMAAAAGQSPNGYNANGYPANGSGTGQGPNDSGRRRSWAAGMGSSISGLRWRSDPLPTMVYTSSSSSTSASATGTTANPAGLSNVYSTGLAGAANSTAIVVMDGVQNPASAAASRNARVARMGLSPGMPEHGGDAGEDTGTHTPPDSESGAAIVQPDFGIGVVDLHGQQPVSGHTGPAGPGGTRPAAVDHASMPRERLVGIAATALLAEGFKRCNAGLRLELDFQGLGLTLPPPISKTILSSVTGRIVPGRVTAIMGPSGAGKTTFLSVLMGKVKRTAGVLRINGKIDEMEVYKRITGFVPQDDVMIRELTVRENIEHAARVRLPRRGWTDAMISRHVDAVIQVLGLAGCADTLSCKISGGQRKRTNIGMELAVAPSAIFLDEPTSGLDSTAALEVCSTLKAIADLGLTVVAVIHQPRAEIFASFDDLLLLAPGGLTVYMGPQPGVARYFHELGCPITGSAMVQPSPTVTPSTSHADGLDHKAAASNPLEHDLELLSSYHGSSGNPADELLDAIAGRGTRLVPAALVAEADSISVLMAKGMSPSSVMAQVLQMQAMDKGTGGSSGPARAASESDPSLPGPPSLAVPVASGYPSATARRYASLHGADMSRYLAARWQIHSARTEAAAVAMEPQAAATVSADSWTSAAAKATDSMPVDSLALTTVPGGAGSVGLGTGPTVPVPGPSQPGPTHTGAVVLNPLSSAGAAGASVASFAAVPYGMQGPASGGFSQPPAITEFVGRRVGQPRSEYYLHKLAASLVACPTSPAGCSAMCTRASASMRRRTRLALSIISVVIAHLTGQPNVHSDDEAARESLMADRGATLWQQFLLCHSRCMVQQYRQATWLALELVVCVLAGSIMGLAATAVDELYSGVLIPPYTLLSPAPMETMLPSLGLYVNMAIGVAGSPAAVRTFCEERDVYTREHAGGHSLFAYYLAKNLTATYRLALAALHFAGFFMLLARPTLSFETFFVITLCIFFGVYGLSMLVSMAVSRENAALMGVIASLVVSALCGFGPNIHQGNDWGIWPLQQLAYSRWANEMWMHAETMAYRSLFLVEEVSAAVFGYTLNRQTHDIGMMVLIGLLLRLAAFAALIGQVKLKLGRFS